MDFIPKDRVLEINPDTLEQVRKEINLETPAEIKNMVQILKEWVQQQPHIKKKDFTDHYLETTIICAKGSIEVAKRQIDRSCTMKTLLPHFYGIKDFTKDLTNVFDVGSAVVMPKLTPQNHRIFVLQTYASVNNSTQLLNFYRCGICYGEYMKAHDYVANYHCIFDIRSANISDIVANLNPLDLRNIITIIVDCYGLRVKGMHILSNSMLVDTLISVLKKIMKPKLVQRLQHHKDYDTLRQIIGKDFLPEDLGGTEPSIKQIRESWAEVLHGEEFMNYLQDMNKARTDESLRPTCRFNEDYAGVSGTFRALSVD